MLQRIRSHRNCRRAGFTMVELLVVIAVLALLISLVTAVASKGIHQQRVRNTQQIMQNVTLALDQFAVENPLRAIYDRKDHATFGKFPPYQLLNEASANSVTQILESDDDRPGGAGGTLVQRMWRDMLNDPAGSVNQPDVIMLAESGDPLGNDDNRALYAYLRVFMPSVIGQIPENALKPLPTQPLVFPYGEYINTSTDTVNTQNRMEILGIHDAWGVPLDYMLYVKCERRLQVGGTSAAWVITERKPILRSRGIKRDVYDEWVRTDIDPIQRDVIFNPPEKWIFSEDLPQPWAKLTDGPDYRQGSLPSNPAPPSSADGWVRAVGSDEDYAYRPDGGTPAP